MLHVVQRNGRRGRQATQITHENETPRDEKPLRRSIGEGKIGAVVQLLHGILEAMLEVIKPELVIVQPTPYCNINCSYCYLGSRNDRSLMPREVVEAIVGKIIVRFDPDSSPTFVWHAGEPTVAPLDWYEYAHKAFKDAFPTAGFSLQTNAVALNDEWASFLFDTATAVGVSIDGPKAFHDARRRTRTGGGTWDLSVRGLHRLQRAGLRPAVISVLSPTILSHAREYFEFIRTNEIEQISLSIDEVEGANATSSFAGGDFKEQMSEFIYCLLDLAYSEGWPLHIKEVERIAKILHGSGDLDNEQTRAWGIIVIAANGDVTTFSPEFMESKSFEYNNFRFGNVITSEDLFSHANETLASVISEINLGIRKCRDTCGYFQICGGGAPINKWTELGALRGGETSFCKHTIQPAADALLKLIRQASYGGGIFVPTLATS